MLTAEPIVFYLDLIVMYQKVDCYSIPVWN